MHGMDGRVCCVFFFLLLVGTLFVWEGSDGEGEEKRRRENGVAASCEWMCVGEFRCSSAAASGGGKISNSHCTTTRRRKENVFPWWRKKAASKRWKRRETPTSIIIMLCMLREKRGAEESSEPRESAKRTKFSVVVDVDSEGNLENVRVLRSFLFWPTTSAVFFFILQLFLLLFLPTSLYAISVLQDILNNSDTIRIALLGKKNSHFAFTFWCFLDISHQKFWVFVCGIFLHLLVWLTVAKKEKLEKKGRKKILWKIDRQGSTPGRRLHTCYWGWPRWTFSIRVCRLRLERKKSFPLRFTIEPAGDGGRWSVGGVRVEIDNEYN